MKKEHILLDVLLTAHFVRVQIVPNATLNGSVQQSPLLAADYEMPTNYKITSARTQLVGILQTGKRKVSRE